MELFKDHIKNVIQHKNTLLEQQKDRSDRGIQIFKYIRPYIIRLFFHTILIFLSIRAYLDFLESSTAYDTFKETLNEKVVMDIQIQDYSKTCDEIGYEEIEFSYFPKILNGCRCQNLILPDNLCKDLKEYNYTDNAAKQARETCALIDKKLNNSTNSQTSPRRNLIDLRNLEIDDNNEFKG